jgi:hypothetical protein
MVPEMHRLHDCLNFFIKKMTSWGIGAPRFLLMAAFCLLAIWASLIQEIHAEALTFKALPYTNTCFGTTAQNITNSKIYFYFAVRSLIRFCYIIGM